MLSCVIIKDGIKYQINKTSVNVVGYTDDIGESINIPKEVDGLPVVEISFYAFRNCKAKNIELPDTVISIGDSAFDGCGNLKNMKVPDNVETIGHKAFANCSILKNITLGLSVNYINSEAFKNCESLTDIKVNKQNKYLCDVEGVLFTKDKKRLIRYPENKSEPLYVLKNYVSEINDYAFLGCKSLESLLMPKNMKYIGLCAFWGCKNLKTLCLPKTEIKYTHTLLFGNDVFPEIFFNGMRKDFKNMFNYNIYKRGIAKNQDGYRVCIDINCTDGVITC